MKKADQHLSAANASVIEGGGRSHQQGRWDKHQSIRDDSNRRKDLSHEDRRVLRQARPQCGHWRGTAPDPQRGRAAARPQRPPAMTGRPKRSTRACARCWMRGGWHAEIHRAPSQSPAKWRVKTRPPRVLSVVRPASMPSVGLRDTRALTAKGLASSRPAGPVLRSEWSQWAVTVSRIWRVVCRVEGNDMPDAGVRDYHPRGHHEREPGGRRLAAAASPVRAGSGAEPPR